MSYDAPFFDTISEGCKRSARVVVPILHNELRPARVVDVGAGEGWWAAEWARLGCHVTAIDGPGTIPHTSTSVLVDRWRSHDLNDPLPVGDGEADVVTCLEVAEHLPEERAGSLIAELCAVAPVVVFSAAIPGQGGTGHINEQWPGYWADLFQANGFTVSGAVRWRIWTDTRVENWYAQNCLVAAAKPSRYPEIFDTPLAPPIPVVHPVLYNARRAT